MAFGAPTKPKRPNDEHKICGTVEIAVAEARQKRERRKPQPWIVRKLMVGITLGIFGYAAYVYIGRLCIPMILRTRRGGRGAGIALLVVFATLFLWSLWAYIKVVVTAPGYAKDFVEQSGQPMLPAIGPRESWNSTTLSHLQHDLTLGSQPPFDLEAPHREPLQAGPSYEDILMREGRQSGAFSASHAADGTEETQAGMLDPVFKQEPSSGSASPGPTTPAPARRTGRAGSSSTFLPSQAGAFHSASSSKDHTKTGTNFPPIIPAPNVPSQPSPSPLSPTKSNRLRKQTPQGELSAAAQKRLLKQQQHEQKLAELNVRRRPPTTPILLPANRYCSTDKIVKPYRAHHCRICGTCVLKYDHHCPCTVLPLALSISALIVLFPGIGQCVGARNHKFFYNFCQATAVLTAYTFASLLAYTIRDMNDFSSPQSSELDPQHIVGVAISGLFCLFTSVLLVSHTRLILTGQSTVESMSIHSMRERESTVLARGFQCWELSAKAQRRRLWDDEWGKLDTEGNIWWRGSAYTEWVDVMGKSKLGWFLPIGRSERNGLDYPINPRFDAEGRWRRREEWPEELR